MKIIIIIIIITIFFAILLLDNYTNYNKINIRHLENYANNIKYVKLLGDCAGNNIKIYNDTDKAGCEMRCTKNEDCQGFSIYKKQCITKSASCGNSKSANNDLNENDWTFYKKINQPSDDYKKLLNDCPGNNINTYDTLSLSDCKKKCTSDPNCKGISYSISPKECITKSKACDEKENSDQSLTNKGFNFYKKEDDDDKDNDLPETDPPIDRNKAPKNYKDRALSCTCKPKGYEQPNDFLDKDGDKSGSEEDQYDPLGKGFDYKDKTKCPTCPLQDKINSNTEFIAGRY